jgi:hypothetical protein
MGHTLMEHRNALLAGVYKGLCEERVHHESG